MDDKRYLQQIEHCLDEIESLVLKKQQMDRRIDKLQRVVKANAEMLPDESRERVLLELDDALPPTGFTEAIRYALRRAGAFGMTPMEVKTALIAVGIPLTQSNPMAAIHTVLKRLVDGGEVRVAIRDKKMGGDDESVYQWKTLRGVFGTLTAKRS
jgi:hypothetical protein